MNRTRQSRFQCKFCGEVSGSIRSHIIHFRHHRNITKRIQCGYERCLSFLPSESALRSHIIKRHGFFVSQVRRITGEAPTSYPLLNENATFQCKLEYCGQQFFCRRFLMSHLKSHIKDGIHTPCPVRDCDKIFSSWHSLTGHTSRYHREREATINPLLAPHNNSAVNIETGDAYGTYDENLLGNNVEESQPEREMDQSLQALAQFFLKIECKHLVPESTVQLVAKEMKLLLVDSENHFLRNLKLVLEDVSISSEVMDEILQSMRGTNNIARIFNCLRSTYMRKKFFKMNFSFVEPVLVPLRNDNFFYYVPLEETLQAAFKNKSWNINLQPCQPIPGLFRDFTDGEVFRNNTFFQENPNALRIILYQDSFQLVCPIGPAKNLKHKVTGVYMALGNLPPEVRFQKDSIQLVALVRDCDFQRELVYGRIVDDFMKIQVEGIEVPGIGRVKAGLAFIAGDNLGSHQLAGIIAGFSRGLYFCRYCLLYRPQFYEEDGENRRFARRTPQSYDNALTRMTVNANGKVTPFKGVQYNSEFNEINGFHVCGPGLPPCLGHDLCEGVISYDLKLFIRYFIEEKEWFTLDQLNYLIEKFPYSIEETRDKPKVIKSLERETLVGGAWQIWTMLRLFPLIVLDKIKDFDDPVWRILLLLREITMITLAPEIHESHLPGYQCLIDEYLFERRQLFPDVPLKPKHHYMSHYPELILYFGPLIKCWTLRFESKHTFFKQSWKSSNNSINILQTLCFKHEFFQSWARLGSIYKPFLESGERHEFIRSLYCSAISNAVNAAYPFVHFEECRNVHIKGTEYRKGHVLILNHCHISELLHVGVIHLILLSSDENLLFVVRKGTASLNQLTGIHELKMTNEYECVNYEDLLSFYPLTKYERNIKCYIALKHAIVGDALQI